IRSVGLAGRLSGGRTLFSTSARNASTVIVVVLVVVVMGYDLLGGVPRSAVSPVAVRTVVVVPEASPGSPAWLLLLAAQPALRPARRSSPPQSESAGDRTAPW